MYEITVKISFSAAHSLRNHPGPCGNIHGHNWEVEAVYSAKKPDARGMVADFHDVEGALAKVTARLDHKNINDVPPFASENPTAEKIAEWIFRELEKEFHVPPSRVTVRETEKTSATFIG